MIHRLLITTSVLIASLLSASSTQAQTTVDDFESYATTSALQAEWRPSLGSPNIVLETTQVQNGNLSMNVSGNYSALPIISVTNKFLPSLDWSAASSAKISYKGYATNTPVDIVFQLLSSSNQLIAQATAAAGTTATSWTDISIAFAGQSGLEDVRTIQIAMLSGFPGDAASVYFDDLEVTFPTVNADVTVSESGGSTAVTEGITNETVSVSLASMPANSVTVTPSFISSILNVTPNPGVISPAGWMTPLQFSVTAKDDNIIEGSHTGILTFVTSSPDANYNNLSTSNIHVTVTDNDFIVIPEIDLPYIQGTNLRFYVDGENNQLYNIEIADDPLDPTWTKKIINIPGSGATFNFPIPMSQANGSVRVTTVPNPSP